MNAGMYVVMAIVSISVLLIARGIWREGRRIRANERFESGLCVECGYDLRGTKHERCPECGFPVQAPELPLTMELSPKLLLGNWPEEDIETRKPGEDEYRVEVYTSGGDAGKFLLDQFRARGMDAEIRASSMWSTSTKWQGGRELKFLTVSVWSGDVERAVELIRGLRLVRRGRK